MSETAKRVPPHLRRFVVTQDYGAYTAVDQAVWRFVLLQLRDRLGGSAHPAYTRGLEHTGMSVERIPRIEEMDECLGRFGWGAVCVDGFIPPRAFQELQALAILPIAAEIRRVEHLPYTPAPDIIHEAAGHAPILPNADYAGFLRRIGEHGMRAFSSQRDARLYAAIHRLSVVKEQRDADPREIAAVEHELAELVAEPARPSEAAVLSRLYWWTVEYGLIGTPKRYKLYGAGLLSSLGESYFCRRRAVRKLPLDRSCAAVDYDITRPQPQLFVTRDFAQLGEVLEQVCAPFAFRKGGLAGLRTAVASGELATLSLDSGLHASGVVAEVVEHAGEPCAVRLAGEAALGDGGRILRGHGPKSFPDGLVLVLGRGSDEAVRAPELGAGSRAKSGALRVTLASGLRIEGMGAGSVGAGPAQRIVLFREARVLRRGRSLFGDAPATVAWLAGTRVISVRAGAEDASFLPDTTHRRVSAPQRQPEDSHERARRRLYERTARLRAVDSRAVLTGAAAIHTALERAQPHEWLLRWNLLELLTTLKLDPERRLRLRRELLELERKLERRYPIATGLRYLAPGRAKRPTLKVRAASRR